MKQRDLIMVFAVVLLVSVAALGFRGRRPGEDVFDLGDIFAWKESAATVSLTIVYSDNSERTFEATPLQLTKLTITDDTGKEVKEVRANVKVMVQWEGEYRSQATTGKIKLYVNDALKNTKDFTYNLDLPGYPVYVSIATVTYTNTGLEAWLREGENTLRVVAPLKVTITFADGSTDSKTGQGGVTFSLNKNPSTARITVVQVSVARTLLR